MGWGGFVRRPKTKSELALERRRELGEKYFSDIAELQAIAAKCRKKPKKLPPAPHPDDIIADPAPSVTGPCQLHVASMKARRAGTAVQDDQPCVDGRRAKLEASRAYHRARYKAKKAKLATPGGLQPARHSDLCDTLEGSTLRNSSLNFALSSANNFIICRRSAAFRASLSLR
jgi:hypothetical protein